MRKLLLLALACLPLAAQTSDRAVGLVNEAYQRIRSGDLVGAIASFEDAARLAPHQALIAKELGHLYLKNGEPELAVTAFTRALALDPLDQGVRLQLAQTLQRLGRTSEARARYLELTVGTSEQAETAWQALARLEEGDPARILLEAAYEALESKDYSRAIEAFRAAAERAPGRSEIHQELGYALLKAGRTEAARDAFDEALRLNPADERVALELAFLRHETDMPAEALSGFQTLANSEDPGVARTARDAAARIEAELGGGIERWERAVEIDPRNRSARLDLADLYERRGEVLKAAGQMEAAWGLEGPNRDEILLRLGQARLFAGRPEEANGAWLLASRSAEVRIAETARELLPPRYPFANEFRAALALDPGHIELRRDLAYLLLEVGDKEQALVELETLAEAAPADLQIAAQLADLYLGLGQGARAVELLERSRGSTDPRVSAQADRLLSRVREQQAQPLRRMGEKSLSKSYLNDALQQFEQAWEANPSDHAVALKLGVVHNLLHRDRQAIRWFKLASESEERSVSEQALRSYDNLAPQFRRFTTTFWMYPLYSKRFGTVFGYAQAKAEMRLGAFRPYLSLRAAGDARRHTGGAEPQLLSESSLIAAFGLRAPLGYGLTLWGEAGRSVSYLHERPQGEPRWLPDYRGGLNWFRARGATLGGGEPGRFHEMELDAVYLSRFDDDALAYWRYRPGYRLPDRGRLRAQVYLNWNVTVDTSREYWANTVELGPGLRIRVPTQGPPMDFSIDVVRGVHLSNRGNTLRPNYLDVRAGLWYSFTK